MSYNTVHLNATCNTPHHFVTEFWRRRRTVWQCSEQQRICLPPQDSWNVCWASGTLWKYELIVPESLLPLKLRCTSRVLFLCCQRKITINFVNSVAANICHFIPAWPLRLLCPSRVLMASPGGPSFSELTSPAVTFVRCSFRRASIANFSHLISPWLECWPENNSAAITICWDCGFGAAPQHLCYTVIWASLTETFPTSRTSPRPLSRCSPQHGSPIVSLRAEHVASPC